jgi:tetratricopeptide (TPR) repeat protein
VRERTIRSTAALLLIVLGATASLGADWFERVRDLGLADASERDVELYERGRIPADLHIGDCYVHLRRYAEAAEIYRRLRRSADRNYAAAAMVREAESLYHDGRVDEALALFTRCLDEHPDAFLDVDVPELCRAWRDKIAAERAARKLKDADRLGDAEENDDDETARARALEEEIAGLEARIAALRKRLEHLK